MKNFQKQKRYLIAGLVVALALTFLVCQYTAEPEDCALCGGLKCHAPCIVNLATGEVGELTIYEPHPTLVGEIAEEQPGGTFAFVPCAGLRAVQDTDARTCSVQLSENHKKANPRYFCRSCKDLLSKAKGYALVDLYDLGNIGVYPIEDGAAYVMRQYVVSVEWDDETEAFNVVNRSQEPN